MQRAYKQGTLYAFLLVGLLSAVIVRRTRESVIATISLMLGTLCTIGGCAFVSGTSCPGHS